VSTTGWLKGLQVTADGTGIVSHAGVALAGPAYLYRRRILCAACTFKPVASYNS